MDTYNWPKTRDFHLAHWLPVMIAGAITWLAFVFLGATPPVRALALALVIAVMTLTLRQFGAVLAVAGALALAFSPAFWSQAGGQESQPVIILILVAAGIVALAVMWMTKSTAVGGAMGLIVFVLLFWNIVSTEHSLRLTTLLTAGLLYLLISALLMTNPRPDGPSPIPLGKVHLLGMLLTLTLGILNEPLFSLLAPAIVLGLVLSKTHLPAWYWGLLALVTAYGARGIALQYLDSGWWLYPAANAQNIHVPFVIADGWRASWRWLNLLNLVSGQFTILGVVLGVIGLSRLSRWYPPLGVVTMIAYGMYALFGLVYFGRDSAVLLLPLFMIQVTWMTYAVYSFGQWLQKGPAAPRFVRWIAPAAFVLMPLLMLVRITGAG